MRLILAALLVLSLAGTANAQISIGIGLPSISIGVNIPFPELEVVPGFPVASDRAVRITGRAKIDGLLGAEEAVRLQLVAGAGFEPATFGL